MPLQDEKVIPWCIVYMVVMLVIYLVGGGFIAHWSEQAAVTTTIETAFMNQIVDDWMKQPVDQIIKVNTLCNRAELAADPPTCLVSEKCPDSHPISMVDRIWQGMEYGCDCKGKFSTTISHDDTVRARVVCTADEIKAGCNDISPAPPIKITNLDPNGFKLCGRANNTVPFANVTRPSFATNTCPDGYSPCSDQTTVNNTICTKLADKSDCPITYLAFTHSDEADELADDFTTARVARDGSFVTTRNFNSLPQTGFKLSQQPCLDHRYDAMTDLFHPLEIDKTKECPLEPNTQQRFDNRYTALDPTVIQPNEWIIQKFNGIEGTDSNEVEGILMDLTGWTEEFDNSAAARQADKSLTKFKLWSRPTMMWSLECEHNGLTRQKAIELYGIKFNNDKLQRLAARTSWQFFAYQIIAFVCTMLLISVSMIELCCETCCKKKDKLAAAAAAADEGNHQMKPIQSQRSCRGWEVIMIIYFLGSRAICYVMLPMLIHRLNVAIMSLQDDWNKIHVYSAFDMSCGDYLTELDITGLETNIDDAILIAQLGYAFAWSVLGIAILEVVSVIVSLMVICCCSKPLRVNRDAAGQRDAHVVQTYLGGTCFMSYMQVAVVKT